MKLYSGVGAENPGSAMGRTSRASRGTGGSAADDMVPEMTMSQLVEAAYRELRKQDKAIKRP